LDQHNDTDEFIYDQNDIPEWCQKDRLQAALAAQYAQGSPEIFRGPFPRPDLSVIFARRNPESLG